MVLNQGIKFKFEKQVQTTAGNENGGLKATDDAIKNDSQLQTIFQKIDKGTDGKGANDGVLTDEEIQRFMKRLADAAGKDGKLSKHEAKKFLKSLGIENADPKALYRFIQTVQAKSANIKNCTMNENGDIIIESEDGNTEETIHSDKTSELKTTDENQNVTTQYKNAAGAVYKKEVKNPDGTTTITEYEMEGDKPKTDAGGNPVVSKETVVNTETNKTTVISYQNGKKVKSEEKDNSTYETTVIEFDEDGSPKTKTVTKGCVEEQYEYVNGKELLKQKIEDKGVGISETTNYEYDALGNCTQETKNTPTEQTVTTYGSNGDKTEVITEKDAYGNLTQNVTTNTLNSNGNKLSQTKTVDGTTYSVEYDGNGNTKIIVQNGESPAAIAEKFGCTVEELFAVNKDNLNGRKYFLASSEIVVPGELDADDQRLQNRDSKETVIAKYQAAEAERQAKTGEEIARGDNGYYVTRDSSGNLHFWNDEKKEISEDEFKKCCPTIHKIVTEKNEAEKRGATKRTHNKYDTATIRDEASTYAEIIHNQIKGASQNKKTKEKLGLITAENAAFVVQIYKEKYNISLAKHIDEEWGLDIDTVKEFVCKKLVDQAKSLGIDGVYYGDYQKITDIDKLETWINNVSDKIVNYMKNATETYYATDTEEEYKNNSSTRKLQEANAELFYSIADYNEGDACMRKLQELLDEKITPDNICAFLDAYDIEKTKHDDSSIIATVTKEWGASGSAAQKKVLMTILDKLCKAAKKAGVSQGDIDKAETDFKNSYEDEYHGSGKYRETNPKDMEKAIDFLRGAIAAKQTANVEDMSDSEAIVSFNKSFDAEQNSAEGAYDDAKGEGWSWSAQAGDWVCGLFGCNTISEMEAKLEKNAKAVKELAEAKTEAEFKAKYKEVFGIEFDAQKIAAAEAAQTNLVMTQGFEKAIPIYDNLLNNSSNQNLTQLENSFKSKIGIKDEEFVQLKANLYSSCSNDAEKKQAFISYLQSAKYDLSEQYMNITKGKTLEQLEKDTELVTKSAFGTNDIGKDVAQFTTNMATTEMVTEIAGDIALTVALAAIPGGAAAGCARMAATTARWGVRGVKAAKALNKASKGFTAVQKFTSGTKYTSKAANVAAKVVSGSTAAAGGTVANSVLFTNRTKEEIAEMCLQNGIYGAIGAGAAELAPKLMQVFPEFAKNSALANEVAEEIINAVGAAGVTFAQGGEYGTTDATVDIVSGILMARLSHIGAGKAKTKTADNANGAHHVESGGNAQNTNGAQGSDNAWRAENDAAAQGTKNSQGADNAQHTAKDANTEGTMNTQVADNADGAHHAESGGNAQNTNGAQGSDNARRAENDAAAQGTKNSQGADNAQHTAKDANTEGTMNTQSADGADGAHHAESDGSTSAAVENKPAADGTKNYTKDENGFIDNKHYSEMTNDELIAEYTRLKAYEREGTLRSTTFGNKDPEARIYEINSHDQSAHTQGIKDELERRGLQLTRDNSSGNDIPVYGYKEKVSASNPHASEQSYQEKIRTAEPSDLNDAELKDAIKYYEDNPPREFVDSNGRKIKTNDEIRFEELKAEAKKRGIADIAQHTANDADAQGVKNSQGADGAPNAGHAENVKAAAEDVKKSVNDIPDSEIPAQNHKLWNKCKDKIDDILNELQSLKPDLGKISKKMSALFDDIETIAMTASSKVKAQLNALKTKIENMFNGIGKSSAHTLTQDQIMQMKQIDTNINRAMSLDDLNKAEQWLNKMPDCEQKTSLQAKINVKRSEISTDARKAKAEPVEYDEVEIISVETPDDMIADSIREIDNKINAANSVSDIIEIQKRLEIDSALKNNQECWSKLYQKCKDMGFSDNDIAALKRASLCRQINNVNKNGSEIVDLINKNPEFESVISDLALNSKRDFNEIEGVLAWIKANPDKADVFTELAKSNFNIKFGKVLNGRYSIDPYNIAEAINNYPQYKTEIVEYMSVQRYGDKDSRCTTKGLNEFIETLEKHSDKKNIILQLSKNPNMDGGTIWRYMNKYHDQMSKLQDVVFLSNKGYSEQGINGIMYSMEKQPGLRKIYMSESPKYDLIDKNPAETPTDIIEKRFKIREKLKDSFSDEMETLRKTLGNDFFVKVKWEDIIPEGAADSEIKNILSALNDESKFFARTAGNERRYGKNIRWAHEMGIISDAATYRLRNGDRFEDVIGNIANDYRQYDVATTRASNCESDAGMDRRVHSGEYRGDLGGNDEYGASTGFGDYPSYEERLTAMNGVTREYKGIQLTEIGEHPARGDGLFMLHPNDQNVKKAMPIIEKMHKNLEPYIKKVNQGKTLSESEIKKVHEQVAEIYFLMANVMPWSRGSNGIADIYMRSLYKSMNIDMPALKPDVSLDLESFCMDVNEYKTKWLSFFEK